MTDPNKPNLSACDEGALPTNNIVGLANKYEGCDPAGTATISIADLRVAAMAVCRAQTARLSACEHDFEGINQWQTVCRKCGVDLDSLSAPSGSCDEGVVERALLQRAVSLLEGNNRASERPSEHIRAFCCEAKQALRSTPSPTLTPDAEGAALALLDYIGPHEQSRHSDTLRIDRALLRGLLQSFFARHATPAIRDQAYEEAARVCEAKKAETTRFGHNLELGQHFQWTADAIRALKGAPPPPKARAWISTAEWFAGEDDDEDENPSPDLLKELVEALEAVKELIDSGETQLAWEAAAAALLKAQPGDTK